MDNDNDDDDDDLFDYYAMADDDLSEDTDDEDDRLIFADPGGNSALRAGNRIYPCPTCKQPNRLTAKDVALHYQCDSCADRDERGGY